MDKLKHSLTVGKGFTNMVKCKSDSYILLQSDPYRRGRKPYYSEKN